METSQNTIKGLISAIYECQKKIIINRRHIRELEVKSEDTVHLENQNRELEGQIFEFQNELRKRYNLF
jgi:hypothetical protein